MSKEYLDAFDRITLHTEYDNDSPYDSLNFEDDCKLVDNALNRLESIDNANPSEALECLERINNTLCLNNNKGKLEFGVDTEEHTDCDSAISMVEDLETIKQALQRLNKYEQLLGSGRLTDRNYKNTTLDLDSCKPYLRLGQLEDIYEECKSNG